MEVVRERSEERNNMIGRGRLERAAVVALCTVAECALGLIPIATRQARKGAIYIALLDSARR